MFEKIIPSFPHRSSPIKTIPKNCVRKVVKVLVFSAWVNEDFYDTGSNPSPSSVPAKHFWKTSVFMRRKFHHLKQSVIYTSLYDKTYMKKVVHQVNPVYVQMLVDLQKIS